MKSNLIKIAEIIETQEVNHDWRALSGFTMCYIEHECGSPGCIKGFVHWEMHETRFPTYDGYLEARWLGISPDLYGRLTFPAEPISYESITPEIAGRALRSLDATGEFDWIECGAKKVIPE